MPKRIAIVNLEKCKPNDCYYACMKYCPRNRAGDECIVKREDGRIIINEEFCIGCGICVKKCPNKAITIINLPAELNEEPIHQFGKNTFRLYGMAVPVKGEVTGLLGANGIGKTTALKILSGQIKPNLSRYENPPEWAEIIEKYRGSELQNYLLSLSRGETKAVYKPQQVDKMPLTVKGKLKDLIKDERGVRDRVIDALELRNVMDRDVSKLSGGELQRAAIAAAICREGDVYYFDEPSSFLDVRQRLLMARAIRELAEEKAVMVVEHDLATLDFLADRIHMVYGHPGAFGIIAKPYSARRGINTYLGGYIREENVRFREKSIVFRKETASARSDIVAVEYPSLSKKYPAFTLEVEKGGIYSGETIGVFGANALGKTTFAKILAGAEKPDKGKIEKAMKISYKPQYLSSGFIGTVSNLFQEAVKSFGTKGFRHEMLRPLEVEPLLDNDVQNLSGGELQRVAIAICLGQEADFYLLDEPSAYLDVEQRVNFTKMIKRFIERNRKTCLIIDHDILMLHYVSDRAIVFLGESGTEGKAGAPQELKTAMNVFLKDLNVTFRIDPETGRPRANKEGSQKDGKQKAKGEYYAE